MFIVVGLTREATLSCPLTLNRAVALVLRLAL